MLLYRGGIASGKTIAGCARSIIRRYLYPGTTQLIAGPSWDQVRDGTMRTLRRMLNPACVAYENKVDHIWRLDNGSEFIFRTLADPDVLRALEFHDAYIDENAMVSPEALNITLGRVRLPYPQDRTFRHSVWCTTTPRGMDYTLDVWGMEGKPGYGVVHSSIYDNKANLPEGYIERLEEKYRGTPFYEQELLGLYTAFEGLVYPTFRREKHVKPAVVPIKDCPYVAVGLDFGGITPTAMTLLGERKAGGIHQYAEFYKVGATLGDIMARLVEWCDLIECERGELAVACDTSEPVVISTLAAAGFDAFGADKDRIAGIALVTERLNGVGNRPVLTIDPACVYTISEFGQYVWAERSMRGPGATKVVRLTDTPIDHHADSLDALRYCLMSLAQREAPEELFVTPAGRVLYGRR